MHAHDLGTIFGQRSLLISKKYQIYFNLIIGQFFVLGVFVLQIIIVFFSLDCTELVCLRINFPLITLHYFAPAHTRGQHVTYWTVCDVIRHVNASPRLDTCSVFSPQPVVYFLTPVESATAL